MKLKLTSLLMALGLLTNAAFAGNSAKIGYASDFFYRGEQKALESVQAAVDLETALLGLDAKLHACTNQSIDEGVDSYRFAAGLGASVAEGYFLSMADLIISKMLLVKLCLRLKSACQLEP